MQEAAGGAERMPLKRLPVGFNHIRKRPHVQDVPPVAKQWLARPALLTPLVCPALCPPSQLPALRRAERWTSPPASPSNSSAQVPEHTCARSCQCTDRLDICLWRPNGACVDQYLAQAHAANPRIPQDTVLQVYYAEQYDVERANARLALMSDRHSARPQPDET